MSRLQMTFTPHDTGIVLIDPQNDVLSEQGRGWAWLKESVRENRTVENLERLFRAGKARGYHFQSFDL